MNKRLFSKWACAFMPFLAIILLVSCSEKEDAPYIKSTDNGATITAEGNSWAGWSTTLQSNIDLRELQSSSSASWCTARLSALGNDYRLQVSAEDNPTLTARQAVVSVQSVDGQAAVSFTISQQPGKPYISFKDGEGDVTIDAQAKTWERVLESNVDFSKLTVTSSETWCTAKLESSGSGITLKLDANENKTLEERQATITINASSGAVNTSFVVTQQSATPSISFIDGGEDQSITSEGKNWTWEVSSNIEFKELEASSDADWCTVELSQATTFSKKISLSVKVAKNETVSERKAVVTVKSTKYGTETKFTVTQQPFGPNLAFTAGGADQTISPDGKSWSWDLSTNLKKDDLAASSTADWCTVELTGSDTKGISLSVKVAKNETVSERKAVVTVKSTKYGTSLSFNVTQQAGTPTIRFTGTEGKDQTVAAPAKVLKWTVQSNIHYNELKVSSNEGWCQVKLTDSNEAKDVKSYPMAITIAENSTDKQREAVVTISSEKYNVSKSFKITQSAATFKSSHASVGFDRDAGSRTVTISSNASWKAECDADWVTLEQTNDYLTVRVKATTIDRSATITFKDKSSTTIVVNQTKYKVGETYDEGGVTGTVAYIGDDKRFICKNTGKTEPYQQFFLATGTTGTYDMDDGEANMQFIMRQSGWYGNFLAAAAADDLNTGGVTGWYLPAINELKNMKAFVTGSAWSSTANDNGSFSAYCLSGGTVYSNDDRQVKHGVYAIHKF